MTPKEWAVIIVVGILAAWDIFQYIRKTREKRMAEEAGLMDNPTRCAEHQRAIDGLRDDISDINTCARVLQAEVVIIKDDIREIKSRLK